VIQLHGMLDKTCPYDGGASPTGHTFLPAETSIASWAAYSQCQETASTTTTADGNLRIEYEGCTDNVGVVHYGFPNEGHGLSRTLEGGLVNLIWTHFQSHEP